MSCDHVRKVEEMRDHAKKQSERFRAECNWPAAEAWEKEFYVLSGVLAEFHKP